MFDYFLKNIVTREIFLTSYIKQSKKKKRRKKAFKYESVLHRVIPVQPRNLVKKRNLAHFGHVFWPLNVAALEKRESVGPGLSLSCPVQYLRSPFLLQLSKTGFTPDKLCSLLFMMGIKTAIPTSRNMLCVVQRIKDAWIKPVADSWLTGKDSCSIQQQLYQSTQLLYKNIGHICIHCESKARLSSFSIKSDDYRLPRKTARYFSILLEVSIATTSMTCCLYNKS